MKKKLQKNKLRCSVCEEKLKEGETIRIMKYAEVIKKGRDYIPDETYISLICEICGEGIFQDVGR